jgi:hypothetical protein
MTTPGPGLHDYPVNSEPTTPLAPPEDVPVPEAPKRSRKRLWLIGGIVAAVAVAGVTIGLIATSSPAKLSVVPPTSSSKPQDIPPAPTSPVTAKPVSVRVLDRALGSDLKADQTLVRVDVQVTNTSDTETVRLDQGVPFDLYSGANRFKADTDAGWADTVDQIRNDLRLPQQLVPKSSFTYYESFDVPTADLSTMTITIPNPDQNALTADGTPQVFEFPIEQMLRK